MTHVNDSSSAVTHMTVIVSHGKVLCVKLRPVCKADFKFHLQQTDLRSV